MPHKKTDPTIDSLFKSAKKRAQNEVAFQKTNNILSKAAKELVHGTDRDIIAFAFTCECSDLTCTRDIHLTITEFELVSNHPARFCVIEEHNQPDLENVVEKNDTHWVVEKLPGLLVQD